MTEKVKRPKKHGVRRILLLILALLALYGATIGTITTVNWKILLSFRPETYYVEEGTKGLMCRLSNYSFRPLHHGETYFLEKLIDGEWREIDETEEEYRFTMPLIVVYPGAFGIFASRKGYSLEIYAPDIVSGSYRIWLPASNNRRPADDDYEKFDLYCYFEVR